MKKIITSLILFLFIVAPVSAATTLWQYFDYELPSISDRVPLAESCGINNYIGEYEQNISLLECLESKDSLGGNVPITATDWSLALPIGSTDTTIDLVDFNDLRGNAVATTSMPTKIYLALEPENPSNTEIIVCPNNASQVDSTNTRFTGCTRGLSFSGTSESAVTANQKSHSSGAGVIMTNVGQFFNNFVDIDSDHTIAGAKTFSGDISFTGDIPFISTTTIQTLDGQVATKKYVDDVAISGVPAATPSVSGRSKLSATSATPLDPVVVETADTRVPTQDENDALVGTSGTPSTSNPFVTSDDTDIATTSDKLVRRKSNGQISVIETPASSTDAVSKSYFDSNSPGKIHISTDTVSNLNSSTETTLFTTTLSGGELGTNNAILITIPIDDFRIKSSSANMALRLKYGATTVATLTITAPGNSTFDNTTGELKVYLIASGATGTQQANMQINTDAGLNQIGSAESDSVHVYASGTSTEDSTGDLSLSITADNSVQNADFGMSISNAIVTSIK